MEKAAMNLDPVHLAARSGTAEQTQQVLDELEAELATTKARRDKILVDIAVANTASVRDQKARLKLPGLNKEETSVGRLMRSIEMQITQARKRLAMVAQAQANAARAKAAVPVEGEAERLFLVNTPHDLHTVRHKAHTIEELRARLSPGYTIAGEIFGANDDGTGGVVAAIDPKGPSIMTGLLAAFGGELEAWLAKRGIVGSIAQAPELAGDKESVQ
jgi:hypothetical protein